MAFEKTYEMREAVRDGAIKYFFISKGNVDIVKAVEYVYVQGFGEDLLFNFGFGDYDLAADAISDRAISNNGDVYTVFHTVLSTVPRFFALNPNAVMMVQGSDSDRDFPANCRKTCRKKCVGQCKNTDRRINAYRWYVDKNFNDLKQTYVFYGGIRRENGLIVLEEYRVGTAYSSVFCRKK